MGAPLSCVAKLIDSGAFLCLAHKRDTPGPGHFFKMSLWPVRVAVFSSHNKAPQLEQPPHLPELTNLPMRGHLR